jgi:hypothetical protein
LEVIWKKTEELIKGQNMLIDIETLGVFKRVGKPSSRLMDKLDDISTGQPTDDHKSYGKRIFCEIYDKVLTEITSRFAEPLDILLGVAACHSVSTF